MSRTHSHASSLVLGNMTALPPYQESYLRGLLSPYITSRMLRSCSKSLLIIPTCNHKTYSKRAFSYIAPVLWNSLPEDRRSCKSLTTFKSKLKTFLFKRFFFKLTLYYIIIFCLIVNIVKLY